MRGPGRDILCPMNLRILLLITAWLCTNLAAAGSRRLHHEIPDFTQTQVRGAEFGNGHQFCAPAAVSNSLIWLGRRKVDQLELVTMLASDGYMNTSVKNGTGTSGVLRGVDRYANEKLGGYRTLSYQGWRRHPKRFSTRIRVPTLKFIQRGVARRSAAWLNVGWYRANRKTGEYQRIGGHWVTLVGYDLRNDQLIINDPSPRAGTAGSNEYVTFQVLRRGRLTGKKSGLPADAQGYLQLNRGMHMHRKADTAIVDGVVLLEL